MRFAILILSLTLVGCYASRPISDQIFTQESLSKQLNKEDWFLVATVEGDKIRHLKIEAIEETLLRVHSDQQVKMTIPYSTVESIGQYHVSTGKTLGLLWSRQTLVDYFGYNLHSMDNPIIHRHVTYQRLLSAKSGRSNTQQ